MIVEDGSDQTAELWSAPLEAASSLLNYPEGRAALAAARRAGRLTRGGHDRAVAEFETLQDELLLVGVDQALAQAAGGLAGELALPGYDAVHLASALTLGADTTIVTWDHQLRSAAVEAGCGITPGPTRRPRQRKRAG